MKTRTASVIPIITLIALLSFLPGCQKSDDDNTPILPTLTSNQEEVISSSNNFSMELLSRVNEAHLNENIFISPFSVSTALSMTLNGAAGNTRTEIENTLGLQGMSIDQINQAYKDLLGFLLHLDKKVTLNIANSNWYREGLTIKGAFKTTLLESYDADVNAVDFSNPNTVGEINNWVSGKTNNKIRKMLTEIPSNAVMYLINAIYFKADWTYQFDKSETKDRSFYLENGTQIQTTMMHCKGSKFNIYRSQDMDYLDIPYGNGQYQFTVIMKGESSKQTLDEIIAGLDASSLNEMSNNASETTQDLYMPKYKIEYKQKLNEILKNMGMKTAFSNADFSNLFEEQLDLYIDEVLHQSFLEVNEEGSEAAAATSVGIGYTSVGPTGVYIDQPFVFFIREKHSNTILFAGKVVDPR